MDRSDLNKCWNPGKLCLNFPIHTFHHSWGEWKMHWDGSQKISTLCSSFNYCTICSSAYPKYKCAFFTFCGFQNLICAKENVCVSVGRTCLSLKASMLGACTSLIASIDKQLL